jgi:ATP/maltotriose-dependent transcriptional regulator MalT
VVALDVARSWFRYHHLFADLLQLELRCTEPGEVAALHDTAAGWFARHGYPVESITAHVSPSMAGCGPRWWPGCGPAAANAGP